MNSAYYKIFLLGAMVNTIASALEFNPQSWTPQEVSPTVVVEDGVPVFNLPFQDLKSWRFYWDQVGSFDLSQEDRIQLSWDSIPNCAIDQAILYMQSGQGWYRLPGFDVCGSKEAVIDLSTATAEGKVNSWSAIERIRLAFLPKVNLPTVFKMRTFKSSREWSLAELGTWGGFHSMTEIEDSLAHSVQQDLSKLSQIHLQTWKRAKTKIQEDFSLNHRQKKQLILEAQTAMKSVLTEQLSSDTMAKKSLWISLESADQKHFESLWKSTLLHIKSQKIHKLFVGIPLNQRGFKPAFSQIQAAQALGAKVYFWAKIENLNPCDSVSLTTQFTKIKAKLKLFSWDGIVVDDWRYPTSDSLRKSMACRTLYTSLNPKDSSTILDLNDPKYMTQYQSVLSQYLGHRLADFRQSLALEAPKHWALAVYSYPEVAKTAVYQDWSAWSKEGWVDEILTMTLSGDLFEFKKIIALQKNAMGTIAKLTPVLALQSGMQSQDLWTLAQQIMYLRKQGIHSYSFYEAKEPGLQHLQLLP